MRFDWYGATVSESPGEVAAMLGDGLELVDFVKTSGMHGYSDGFEVRRGEDTLVKAWYGGNKGTVHVRSWGRWSEAVAAVIRKGCQTHKVTRADVCEDFQGSRAWGSLLGACRGIRERYGVSSEMAGDWEGEKKGRTYYLGARASAVRVRLYEKGRQLQAKGHVGIPADWVRLEVAVRPGSPGAKIQAARMAPVEFWGATRWTRDLAELLRADELTPFPAGSVWEPDDKQKSRDALLRQYQRTLRDLADDLGGWEAVGPWMRDRLAELDGEGLSIGTRAQAA